MDVRVSDKLVTDDNNINNCWRVMFGKRDVNTL